MRRKRPSRSGAAAPSLYTLLAVVVVCGGLVAIAVVGARTVSVWQAEVTERDRMTTAEFVIAFFDGGNDVAKTFITEMGGYLDFLM